MYATTDRRRSVAASTIGVVAIGRGTFDLDLGRANTQRAWAVLQGLGSELVGDRSVATSGGASLRSRIDDALGSTGGREGAPADAASVDVVVVLQATFTDARPYIEIADRSNVPVVVWSFPEPRTGGRLRLNSFCGANLAAYSLRRRAHPAAFLHADPLEEGVDERVRIALAEAVRCADQAPPPLPERRAGTSSPAGAATAERVAAQLAGAVVGVVGEPPSGFEPCRAPTAAVREMTGVEVDRVELSELFESADRTADAQLGAAQRRSASTLVIDDDVRAAGFAESMRLYCGLRALAERGGWSALSTRCWPECLVDFGGAVCTPQAMLTEDGIPAVCEADLLGSVTALMLRQVADSDPFLADVVDLDERDDTSVLWHCGVASSRFADPNDTPVGIVHPNRGRSLVSQFALRPGPITVARLSQAGAPSSNRDPQIRLVVGSGRVLRRPRPFTGTCGVVEWDRPARDIAATVFGVGLEHHLCVVYGDHRDALGALAARWGMPIIELGAGGR